MARAPQGNQPRLLDQVREAIRMRHYSIRTEEAYVSWLKRYILFHGKRYPLRWVKTRSRSFSRRWPCTGR